MPHSHAAQSGQLAENLELGTARAAEEALQAGLVLEGEHGFACADPGAIEEGLQPGEQPVRVGDRCRTSRHRAGAIRARHDRRGLLPGFDDRDWRPASPPQR